MTQVWRLSICALVALAIGCSSDHTGDALDEADASSDVASCDGCDAAEVGEPPAEICAGPTCVCRIGPAGGSCVTPGCSLTLEQGVLTRERLFSLTEDRVVGEPGEELLGRRACRWETDAGSGDLLREYEVALRFEESEIPESFTPDEVVGVLVDVPTLATSAVTDPARRRIALGVTEPTALAATVVPRAAFADRELGVQDFNAADPATYFRNLTRYRFSAVFHDGQRLYVGNGPRLLVWLSGIPDSPATPPDIVLGRPDLVTEPPDVSASNFSGTVRAVWSDGTRLAVAEGNRVLLWSQLPAANFVPADLVLGQDSFTDHARNKGGAPGADTLAEPSAIWSDGTRLAIADTQNHRVLVWNSFPAVAGQPADVVVGQPAFDTNEIAAGETPLYQARGVYFDGARFAVTSVFACNCVQVLDGFPTTNNAPRDYALGSLLGGNRVTAGDFARAATLSGYGVGGLAVHDSVRVSIWNTFPTMATESAELILGKPDGALGDRLGRISASSFSTPATLGSLYADSSRVLVADGYRVLVWRSLPTHNFAAADLAIGQPSAATSDAEIDYRGISERTLAYPSAVSYAAGITAIADRANNRVLVLRGSLAAPTSITVLGQPSGASYLPATTPSARTLSTPAGVFTDGTRLAVADSGNHRVLVWNTIPSSHQIAADVVLGQADFTGARQNRGLASADATTLHYPSAIWLDGDTIAVADTFNHRVLLWEGPAGSGSPATRVIGQADFNSSEPNRGAGWFLPDADRLARPTGVAVLDDGRIAIADSENNRVLLFAASELAETVLGQPDFTSNTSPNWLSGFNSGWPAAESSKSAAAGTLRWPYAVAARGDQLLVADAGNHRVLRFSGPFGSGMNASEILGQPTPTSRVPNAGGLGARALSTPEGVAFGPDGPLVADSQNHRVLGFDGAPDAAILFGQTVFGRNSINGSSPAFDALDRPAGLAAAGDAIWVADRGHHRVVSFEGQKISGVLGQLDRGGALRHAGLAGPTGWTMSQPADVWTDGTRMIVADRDNHRVLIWHATPSDPTRPADVVIGQPDHTSNGPNRGATTDATAASLHAPDGVEVQDGRLYVADSGNNRILIYDTLPMQTGAAADRVLCQPDFAATAPNRGTSDPTSSSCAAPADALVIGEHLFVADSLNHRVLRFDLDAANGAAATLVLGQPDFATRRPLGPDRTPTAAIFSDPRRLATDGQTLFVVDRGNHRVLLFDEVPSVNFAAADRVLGQVGFDAAVVTDRSDSFEAPDGILAIPDSYNRTTLWIADAGKDRVVRFVRVARRF